ncbi:glycosyltransferase family 2 protein [Baia soyae]|uniref:GT2 family glycosyltransferase n=1 Tax=Baia soyae TaxID=1544746 RepID=A0A4R2RYC4_9BACL|nr:glycosyltransferase family 2 protein [Baia soyae]TCP69689.1 GT2 family glycosyltransferase [Baia soyae]
MSDLNLTSIVIPVHNQWPVTQMCLRSLFRHTRIPIEVIIVNNASTDVTEKKLIKEFPTVKQIHNSYKNGFSASLNQGFRMAKGKYLATINNDTLPSHRWLANMLRVLKDRPLCGVTAPLSNYVLPDQYLQTDLKRVKDIHMFCKKFNRQNLAKWKVSDRLSGFCLVFPRKIWNTVGEFDENYGMGYYEDIDFTYRVRLAGYKCMIAGDTYVHHFGSKSFIQNNSDELARKLSKENREYFMKKWDRDPDLPLDIPS